MKKMNMTALSAVATVLASPFRGLFGVRQPAPLLNVPTRDLSKIDLSQFEVAREPASPLTAPVLAMPRAIAGTVRAEVTGDVKLLFNQLNGAFEEFKTSHEEKLKAKVDDTVLNERISAINATLTDLEKAMDEAAKAAAAAKLHGGDRRDVPDAEYSKLFGSFVREGTREQEDKLKSEQRLGIRAAMSEGSAADGGLTAPIEWDRTVTGRLKLISPIRAEATVQSISKAGFIKLFTDRSIGSGWVGETAARPATSTPQFTALPFVPGEIYANAAASQDLLDDSEVNIETWLTSEIDIEFSRQEGIAFVGGDGSNKPFGVLGYVTGAAAAARHPWGAILTRNSGNATALTADQVSNIVYDLPAMYSPNAKWFMNRTTMAAVRLLQDSQKRYLWQPSYQVGQPSTLLGAAIVDVPDMPVIGAGTIPLLFGDMRETYLVVDRIGFRVLRDPYTNKPYICFYCTKRVGGGVKNPDAMKAMVIGA